MKEIILAGGSEIRLYPLTMVISKQLFLIYVKLFIYIHLMVLMSVGVLLFLINRL